MVGDFKQGFDAPIEANRRQIDELKARRDSPGTTPEERAQLDEQITGFHLAGDLVGFDAIGGLKHPSFAQALETSMVCEIPFETLDDLSGKMPNLRQQIMRLMSGEIKGDQDMILLLSKKNAEERLAAFVYNLSRRFAERGFSPREFRLTMTRGDIGNYLGLTVETISRLLGRFQKSEILSVKGKYITIENADALSVLAGTPRINVTVNA